MAAPETDRITGVETTGHDWDGIKELNNPLPRWWLWTFYASIVWALGYMVVYPAWPLVTEATAGLLGWSSRAELHAELADAQVGQDKFRARLAVLSPAEIRQDAELYPVAVAGGRSAFLVNCVQCHGSGAQGFKGFPNLNDDAWLWGGTLEAIETTIRHGIRFDADDSTRVSAMPAFGRDKMLNRQQIGDVVHHVQSLSAGGAGASAAGAAVYAENCAACHGPGGEGNRELGAPRLNDAIWLYGSDRASIMAQVNAPQNGIMPAWGHRLDATTIKQLALFVHSLGGGE